MKKLLLFLSAGALLSVYAESPNLLKNGSFEDGVDAKGVPKHWFIDRADKVDWEVKLVPQHATHGKTAVFFLIFFIL